MAHRTKYRRHIIRTSQRDQKWSALAARGKDAVRPIQFGPTKEGAILAVKAELDAFFSQQLAQRGTSGFPTAEETRWALAAVKMTPAQRSMLTAHFWAPDNIMTATELAEAGGYDSYVSANSQYGLLGRNLSDELEWEPPLVAGTITWTSTLATGADNLNTLHSERDGHWRWKLRPEIVEALKDGFGPGVDHLTTAESRKRTEPHLSTAKRPDGEGAKDTTETKSRYEQISEQPGIGMDNEGKLNVVGHDPAYAEQAAHFDKMGAERKKRS